MDNNINKIDLGPYINSNPALWDYCWHIYNIENILKSEDLRYLYLVNLISSDTIVNKKSAQDSLDEIKFIKDNIKYINIDDTLKKKLKKYINDGLKIVKGELKYFQQKDK